MRTAHSWAPTRRSQSGTPSSTSTAIIVDRIIGSASTRHISVSNGVRSRGPPQPSGASPSTSDIAPSGLGQCGRPALVGELQGVTPACLLCNHPAVLHDHGLTVDRERTDETI